MIKLLLKLNKILQYIYLNWKFIYPKYAKNDMFNYVNVTICTIIPDKKNKYTATLTTG